MRDPHLPRRRGWLRPSLGGALVVALAMTFGVATPASSAVAVSTAGAPSDNERCRPDGLYRTPNLDVPYCTVYDTEGREKMGADHPRRIIGYFVSWRHGKNNQPAYLAKDIPWDKVTHINYAFAHVDRNNRISVGSNNADNPSTGMEWPGVPGAEMDPAYSFKGHFNLLNKFKKQHPNVKTLISVGGWAETGGYFDDNGVRQNTGGFYTMTTNADGSVNTAGINAFADSAVEFIRQYGFNGVDIDHEYATSANYAGYPDDFQFSQPRRPYLFKGYVALMQTLREKLDAASVADGRHYLLTAATSASAWILRGSEAYQVTEYLDFANVMTYDLHGAWNEYVGPQAALYDDGKDAELEFWDVYTTPQYDGVGTLNTDWAYHYFRGAMQAGRINLGLPYYSRGWQGVTGGTNGLWGKAPLPDQDKCPPGTGHHVGSKVPCGDGAVGIDNIWHDKDADGNEMGAGASPLWHAMNLERGLPGSYLGSYGLDPTNDPTDRLTGTYARHTDNTQKASWLWNDTKKVFLSVESEQTIAAKADYVVSKGIGGVMFWELSGDYAWHGSRNNGQGEFYMGNTLTSLLYDKFRTASPYGARRAPGTMPTDLLDVKLELTNFPVGDANYPIHPKMQITNNTNQTIPGGTVIEYDYGTSAPPNATDQSGFGLAVTDAGHSGNNVGGLRGDFQHVRLTVPTWRSIRPGQSITITYVYYLPAAMPSNVTLTFGGKSYGLVSEYPRR